MQRSPIWQPSPLRSSQANLEYEIKKAKDEDKFDDGVVDLRGQSIAVEPTYPRKMGTDSMSHVDLQHFRLGVARGVSHELAKEMLAKKAAANPEGKPLPGEGIYVSKRPLMGRERDGIKAHALLLQKPIRAFALNPTPTFKVIRPGTGLGAPVVLREFTSDGRYKLAETDEAFKGWTACYKQAERYCSHGPNCALGAKCTVGRMVQKENVLTGAVLPFWNEIQRAVGFRYNEKGAKKSLMRIVRVRIDKTDAAAEQRIVGVQLNNKALERLQAEFSSTSGAGPSSAASASAYASHSRDVKPTIKPEVKPGGAAQYRALEYPWPKGLRAVGMPVKVHGLLNQAQYNGKQARRCPPPSAQPRGSPHSATWRQGLVIGYADEHVPPRYNVRLLGDSAVQILVKYEKLAFVKKI